MISREKLLGMSTAGIAAATIGALIVNGAFLKPARDFHRRREQLAGDNDKMEVSNQLLLRDCREMLRLRRQTYADSTLHAGVLISKRLGEIAGRAGIGQGDVTITTFTGGARGGDFKEVGCTVSGQTTLERLTNLMFLLREDPYAHRITNMDITPQQRDRDAVRFTFRYVSPVFEGDPPKILGAAATMPTQPAEIVSLTNADRARYDVIPKRNFFKPYVPPAPPTVARVDPPRPDVRPPTPTPTPQPRPSYLDQMIVLGLSRIGGEPEILIGRPGEDVRKVYALGEKLEFGEIVMVDAREMPMPTDPDQISPARLIVKAGKDYWAVELDQPLGKRRVMKPEELPEELKAELEPPPEPETRPAKSERPAPGPTGRQE